MIALYFSCEQSGYDPNSPCDRSGFEALISPPLQECDLLFRLHHPNIVQFMGIQYCGENGDPNKKPLIMEYLPSSVEDCITKCKEEGYKVPLSSLNTERRLLWFVLSPFQQCHPQRSVCFKCLAHIMSASKNSRSWSF